MIPCYPAKTTLKHKPPFAHELNVHVTRGIDRLCIPSENIRNWIAFLLFISKSKNVILWQEPGPLDGSLCSVVHSDVCLRQQDTSRYCTTVVILPRLSKGIACLDSWNDSATSSRIQRNRSGAPGDGGLSVNQKCNPIILGNTVDSRYLDLAYLE